MRPISKNEEGGTIVEKTSGDTLSIQGQKFTFDSSGSGKTYIIWGPTNALLEDESSSNEEGFTPHVFERLFSRINEILTITYLSNPSVAPPLSTIQESVIESAEQRFEMERARWNEAESKWISLIEDLECELEASRLLVEKQKNELDIERKCSKELKDAMEMAMEGHARMLEQYADLEEKHINLLTSQRRIENGILDVKKAAAKARVKTGELLVRLKEAEEAVVVAEAW
nr:kinesin-like protein KIN-12B [Tanacetum cinerariifolium]